MIASEATKTLLLPPSTYLSFSRSLPTFPLLSTRHLIHLSSVLSHTPVVNSLPLLITIGPIAISSSPLSSPFFQLEIHFHSHAYHHSRYCVYSSVIVTPQVYGFLFLPQSIDTPCTATPVTPLCISLCHSFIPSWLGPGTEYYRLWSPVFY